MKYKRFEDLPVWQAAADLAVEMFDWTTAPELRGKGDLANQLQRATLSISNNIAEGFERGSTAERIQFIYYARGSAGEVRSMLAIALRMTPFTKFEGQVVRMRQSVESIARQLHGWASHLQNLSLIHISEPTRPY